MMVFFFCCPFSPRDVLDEILDLVESVSERFPTYSSYTTNAFNTRDFYPVQGDIISMFHVCMVWIEKSVTRVTDRHHEACRVMPNSDPE